ncbi:hypothetical protein DYB37_003278 [Aphanomyces astaci]|uniref:Uncharacterized protein n=1 Tax=Aphanomyces astaci TaxID=112090 RepID=A0A3R6XCZ3_APHAT|nr:hypothetical protein DYB35_002486 [Aphanomyces astaci]RHZ06507.1 hypothetical protein DYB37_003278 [Aphanomyces astaci]
MPPVIYTQLQDDIYVYNMHLSRLFANDEGGEGRQDPTTEIFRASMHPENDECYEEGEDDDTATVIEQDMMDLRSSGAVGRVIDEIEDPLAFMRAVHTTWRHEIAVAEGRMAKSTARHLLQIDPSEVIHEQTNDGAFLRSRYRAVCLGESVDISQLNEAFIVLSCVSDSTCELDKLPHKTLSLLLRTHAQGLHTIIEITDLCRQSQTGWVSEGDSTFDYIGGLSVRVLLAVANTDVGRDELAFEHQHPMKKPSIRPVLSIVSDLIHQNVNDVNINMIILALDILSLMGRQEAAQSTILTSTMAFWHALQLVIVHGTHPSKHQLVCAALRCVRVLAGFEGMDAAPRPDVQNALTALVPMWTPTFMAAKSPVDEIVSIVFQDLYVPQFIWFDDMRCEVQAYLDTLLEFQVPPQSFYDVARQFSFDALDGEPMVGGIFLRVYKQGPDRALPPAVAADFCEQLLVFLYDHAIPGRPRYDETLLALECFALLTETSAPDVERSCLSSFSEPPLLHALGLFMTMGVPKSNNGGFDVDAVQRRDAATTCMRALARHCDDATVLAPLSPFCQDMLAMAELQAGETDAPLACLQELCEASPDIAKHVLTSTVWITLFAMMIQAKHYVTEDQHMAADTLRRPAAAVWYALLHGSDDDDVQQLALERLKLLLPYALMQTLVDDPDEFDDEFEESAFDAELIWNDHTRGDLRSHVEYLVSQPNPSFPDDQMDYTHLDHGVVVGDFYLDLFLQNPEATSLRHPFHIASQLVAVWQQELANLIPLASQSMMSPPFSLPELVERGVDNAGLVNKLTNALVFIYREYVDVKATVEDDTTLCTDLMHVLVQCQTERAIGFPQTCVLRLMQVFATNHIFDTAEGLQALLMPLVRKHQDPILVLDIVRTILETHLGKPKPQQAFDALHVVRELGMLAVVMGYVDGSADMSNVRRPAECQALAISISRMLQPLDLDPSPVQAAPIATTRASLPNMPTEPPRPSVDVVPRPTATPSFVHQLSIPTVRSSGRRSMPANYPYSRNHGMQSKPQPPPPRKLVSEVSIDSASVDHSFIAPLVPTTSPESHSDASDPRTSAAFHRVDEEGSEQDASEYEVDIPSEVEFDLHNDQGMPPPAEEYDL